jgi:hypothetical protein
MIGKCFGDLLLMLSGRWQWRAVSRAKCARQENKTEDDGRWSFIIVYVATLNLLHSSSRCYSFVKCHVSALAAIQKLGK